MAAYTTDTFTRPGDKKSELRKVYKDDLWLGTIETLLKGYASELSYAPKTKPNPVLANSIKDLGDPDKYPGFHANMVAIYVKMLAPLHNEVIKPAVWDIPLLLPLGYGCCDPAYVMRLAGLEPPPEPPDFQEILFKIFLTQADQLSHPPPPLSTTNVNLEAQTTNWALTLGVSPDIIPELIANLPPPPLPGAPPQPPPIPIPPLCDPIMNPSLFSEQFDADLRSLTTIKLMPAKFAADLLKLVADPSKIAKIPDMLLEQAYKAHDSILAKDDPNMHSVRIAAKTHMLKRVAEITCQATVSGVIGPGGVSDSIMTMVGGHDLANQEARFEHVERLLLKSRAGASKTISLPSGVNATSAADSSNDLRDSMLKRLNYMHNHSYSGDIFRLKKRIKDNVKTLTSAEANIVFAYLFFVLPYRMKSLLAKHQSAAGNYDKLPEILKKLEHSKFGGMSSCGMTIRGLFVALSHNKKLAKKYPNIGNGNFYNGPYIFGTAINQIIKHGVRARITVASTGFKVQKGDFFITRKPGQAKPTAVERRYGTEHVGFFRENVEIINSNTKFETRVTEGGQADYLLHSLPGHFIEGNPNGSSIAAADYRIWYDNKKKVHMAKAVAKGKPKQLIAVYDAEKFANIIINND